MFERHTYLVTLTLSQLSSSGNPVAIQRAWNLDPSVHWNALEKELLVANVFPVCFQWSSSGFSVVSQCVPIMQINTGSPLGHHRVLASASVVPVASQCTCGSSGLPVWSVQWYPSVLTKSGLEVIRSGHFPACDPLCIQLVWWELFELNWFHLTCNPKYTKLWWCSYQRHAQSDVEVLTCAKSRTGVVTVPPVVFQCRLQKLEFLQWHSSVGCFN